MKKILHNKIPLDSNWNMVLSCKEIQTVHDSIIKQLNENGEDEYIVVTTTTDIKMIDGDTQILLINAEEYTYDKLAEIIEKSQMYDDLCK